MRIKYKKIVVTGFCSLFILFLKAQESKSDSAMIMDVLNAFMNCIKKKDSVVYYSLFHKDPVIWIGISKPLTYQNDLQRNKNASDLYTSSHHRFFRGIDAGGTEEEKFYNIQIIEDGAIASVMFDYSFWVSGKKQNWGKENWAMIKTKGQWKIVSVTFSIEDEKLNPEPTRPRSNDF